MPPNGRVLPRPVSGALVADARRATSAQAGRDPAHGWVAPSLFIWKIVFGA